MLLSKATYDLHPHTLPDNVNEGHNSIKKTQITWFGFSMNMQHFYHQHKHHAFTMTNQLSMPLAGNLNGVSIYNLICENNVKTANGLMAKAW